MIFAVHRIDMQLGAVGPKIVSAVIQLLSRDVMKSAKLHTNILEKASPSVAFGWKVRISINESAQLIGRQAFEKNKNRKMPWKSVANSVRIRLKRECTRWPLNSSMYWPINECEKFHNCKKLTNYRIACKLNWLHQCLVCISTATDCYRIDQMANANQSKYGMNTSELTAKMQVNLIYSSTTAVRTMKPGYW